MTNSRSIDAPTFELPENPSPELAKRWLDENSAWAFSNDEEQVQKHKIRPLFLAGVF